MGFLTKAAILEASDLPFEDVEVPEWGGTIRVRTMPGYERDTFEQAIADRTPSKKSPVRVAGMKARLVALTACNETGELLFSLAEADALNAKSSKALDRLFQVAARLNGMTEEDVEDLAKN